MFLLLFTMYSSYCNRVERSLINLFNSLERGFLLRGRRQLLQHILQKNKSLGSQYFIRLLDEQRGWCQGRGY